LIYIIINNIKDGVQSHFNPTNQRQDLAASAYNDQQNNIPVYQFNQLSNATNQMALNEKYLEFIFIYFYLFSSFLQSIT